MWVNNGQVNFALFGGEMHSFWAGLFTTDCNLPITDRKFKNGATTVGGFVFGLFLVGLFGRFGGSNWQSGRIGLMIHCNVTFLHDDIGATTACLAGRAPFGEKADKGYNGYIASIGH